MSPPGAGLFREISGGRGSDSCLIDIAVTQDASRALALS